ncbi:MAG: hypothetical protein AB1609_17690, partial [Bacillota bacterium]
LVRQPTQAVPEVVRDYRILGDHEGTWRTLAHVERNYLRMRRHRWEPVRCRRLRVEVLATNGAPCAEIFEVRAYPPARM